MDMWITQGAPMFYHGCWDLFIHNTQPKMFLRQNHQEQDTGDPSPANTELSLNSQASVLLDLSPVPWEHPCAAGLWAQAWTYDSSLKPRQGPVEVLFYLHPAHSNGNHGFPVGKPTFTKAPFPWGRHRPFQEACAFGCCIYMLAGCQFYGVILSLWSVC